MHDTVTHMFTGHTNIRLTVMVRLLAIEFQVRNNTMLLGHITMTNRALTLATVTN